MSATKTAPTPNVAASIAIAQPAPATATSAPPSAAPTTAVLFRTRRSMAFACWIRSAGTVCGTIPADAGKKKADTNPFKAAIVSRCHSSARPVSSSTASSPCVAMLARFDPTMTAFRGSRSAQIPPTRRKITCGTDRAARTRPRSVFDPVTSSTAKARAVFAIAFPRNDTARPPKRRRNWRWANGPRRPAAGACPSTASSRRRTARAGRRAPSGRPRPRRPPRRGACGQPRSTRPASSSSREAHRSSSARTSARCSDGDSATPKWTSASRSGRRRSISSKVRNQPSTSRSGGGRDGEDVPAGLDADADCIAGVERPVGVQVADVVRRVAGRREAVEPDDAVAGDLDVLLRDRRQLAPEHVERVAVETARARLEPARVDEVRRPDLGHVDAQPGVLAHEAAGGARMVEVDVREQQVADVGELEPALGQSRLQGRNAGRRPAVVEREPVVGLEQVAGRRPARPGGGGRSGPAWSRSNQCLAPAGARHSN